MWLAAETIPEAEFPQNGKPNGAPHHLAENVRCLVGGNLISPKINISTLFVISQVMRTSERAGRHLSHEMQTHAQVYDQIESMRGDERRD